MPDDGMIAFPSSGCPSFVLHEDGSVTVHEDLCIGDGSCKQTCPVDALVQPRPEVKK
ncbi:MAG: 4Fe-4S binding protein [Planctomycetota bacterium]|nr:4Fe-4S binding protein [Planctomycetota bacterium]